MYSKTEDPLHAESVITNESPVVGENHLKSLLLESEGYPPQDSMKLPYDVLLTIMESQSLDANLKGLSAMTQTCHSLRNPGVKHMLSHRVTLRWQSDIISFSLFMLADESRRFPLLRNCLSIETGRLEQDAAFALVGLLYRISHLERLVLLEADHVLTSDPRLPHAFASLTCLKHLEFSAAHDSDGVDCTYMLRKMRSSLITASLHLPSAVRRWLYGRHNCELTDPVGLLRNSASTLTDLSGTNFEARRHPNVVYPQAKRLRIQFGLIPDISPYIVSFPNITTLEVACGATFDSNTLPSFCWMNEDSQQRFGCWPALEELKGDLTDVYLLSLRCVVTDLQVSARRRHEELHYLADVISRARPTRLRLAVDSTAFPEIGANDLASVFRNSDSACIRELDLRIFMSEGERKADIDTFFERVVKAIELVPLTSFKVDLDCENTGSLSPTSILPRLAVDIPKETLHSWDAERHVDRVRQACPLLRELAVRCSVTSAKSLSMTFDGAGEN